MAFRSPFDEPVNNPKRKQYGRKRKFYTYKYISIDKGDPSVGLFGGDEMVILQTETELDIHKQQEVADSLTRIMEFDDNLQFYYEQPSEARNPKYSPDELWRLEKASYEERYGGFSCKNCRYFKPHKDFAMLGHCNLNKIDAEVNSHGCCCYWSGDTAWSSIGKSPQKLPMSV